MFMNSWSGALLRDLKDPSKHIISSDLAVVMFDKYPKARHHYLVLPREDIPSIFDLNKSHISLLGELHLLALNVIEIKNQQLNNFKIGFHIDPSMQRLHLHVISKDFASVWMKKKKHWNGFNTALFLTHEDLLQQLKEFGQVKGLDSVTLKNLYKMELKCNQCDFKPINIPTLKEHLNEHLNKNFK